MLGGGSAAASSAPKSPLEAASTHGLRPRKEGTATSCVDAQLRGVKNLAGSTGSGTYRIDDGWFVRNLYCDMETHGGGWTLVANVASQGAWPNVNGDLESGFSDGNYPSTGDVWGEEARKKSFFTHFSWIPHEEVLFRTGNGAAWAVVEYNALNPRYKPGSAAPNMRVLAQHGTNVAKGGYTNRLMRAANPEDPWIGFGGDHGANTHIMFYGENGANVHTAFKNANGGVGIFVRAKPVTGAVQWGGHTYMLTERASHYWEAERQANLVGGHLVSVGSQAEQDFLFNTFLSRRGRTFWIGLVREYAGGPFQKWRSGERVAFTAWNRGEPNNWGGNEACTHILDNNRWNDLPCHYALQGIIEVDNQNQFNCHRYVLTSAPLPFAEAEQEAIGLGGHLVAINDPEEAHFVENRFRSKLRQHLWIGLERPAPHLSFSRWTAGDKLDFTDWNIGEPNDWNHNEACTHLLSFSPKWNDIHCGHRFYGVVELPVISSCGISGGDESKAVVANPTATSLHWRLNGVVNDLSGNGIGAYLAGSVSWTNGAPAGARKFLAGTPTLKFNSGAYPQVYNPKSVVPYLSGDASYTFMVWAYYDSQNWPSDWIGVLGTTPSDEHGNFNNGVGLAVYRGKPCMQFYGSEVRARGPLATRTWYHIAGAKAAGSLSANTKLYVDGEAVETRRFGPDGAPQIIAAVPVLGHSGVHTARTLPARYWNGYLKDARVYPSALPADSIKTIYATEW